MPWLIKTELDDMKARHFWQTISHDGSPITYEAFDNYRIPVLPDDLPINLKSTGGPNGVYDFMQGIGASWLVSARQKEIFLTWDSLAGDFFPVILHMQDVTIDNAFFWHRMTKPVAEALDPDKSDAKPVKVAGQVAFYSTPHTPRIVWKNERIGDRHVWADELLRNRLFVSDEVFDEMNTQTISGFKAVVSPFLSEA